MTHAWADPPIVLRCGVAKPAGYSPTSVQTAEVDKVLWYQQVGATTVRWTAVRRQVNIELDVPTSYADQGGLLVELGSAIRATIP